MSEWQPIETLHPRHGLVALITNGDVAYVCEWYTTRIRGGDELWSRPTGVYGHEWEEEFKPSEAIAWMPLPPFPPQRGGPNG